MLSSVCFKNCLFRGELNVIRMGQNVLERCSWLVYLFAGKKTEKLLFHPHCGSKAKVTNDQCTALRPK